MRSRRLQYALCKPWNKADVGLAHGIPLGVSGYWQYRTCNQHHLALASTVSAM